MNLPWFAAVPFVGLLLAIALFPLRAAHWWEKNRNKLIVSLLAACPVVFYYLRQGEWEPLFHSAREYGSFICLLASLYTISGGIHLVGDLEATPRVNSLFLLAGALLANVIGTTGASMLLIRPFLSTNRERNRTSHLPIFFIFLVSNMGGLLTPLGDPPLFLGYLRGVPFFWTLRLFPVWLLAVGLALALFYFWDRSAYQKEEMASKVRDRAAVQPLWIRGRRNFAFLAGVVGAVFLSSPLREGVMILMALLSYWLTPEEVHEKNGFNWSPIIEIAVLFAGIFMTMVPALRLLEIHAEQIPLHEPWQFFWFTGALSSFLDNAPTYLTFFTLGQGEHLVSAEMLLQVPAKILAAISCGAVLMGANSYIGNGPNFMVRAISDQMGVKTPSFFGYMAYSIGILIPIFLVITAVFFL